MGRRKNKFEDYHIQIERAIKRYADARNVLREKGRGTGGKKLFSGNDNIVGDIGEYWVMECVGALNPRLSVLKTDPYDFTMDDPYKSGKRVRVSVKTLTYWSKTKTGSRIVGLIPNKWDFFAAVYLNDQLLPEKIALVTRSEFIKHQKEGQNFRWWKWLEEHENPEL